MIFSYYIKKRLEKGDGDDDDDFFGTGEARDDLSTMPRNVAVKILSLLSITDVQRCAQVSRSWKMITSSSLLWSKVDLTSIKDK